MDLSNKEATEPATSISDNQAEPKPKAWKAKKPEIATILKVVKTAPSPLSGRALSLVKLLDLITSSMVDSVKPSSCKVCFKTMALLIKLISNFKAKIAE
ncbi:hypothetical protein WICPIJ_006330 [Wickerhamomyces pijperi]|uniref:Uncharacterized protein n=1 Tax=Wickerhamomyces pijperi TaxID=599730 RepID=A0A9P8Q2H5_WICPI|nr:hypothetical protein WICPIJ_006330 [Wickerhamomyces pijperi]